MQKTVYQKTLNLGKVAYYGKRRINAVSLELRIEEHDTYDGKLTVDLEPVNDKYLSVSICGEIWNNLHTDIIAGGQLVDEIAKLIPSKRVKRIEELWNRWHLNDMKSGTVTQQNWVRIHLALTGKRYDYGEICQEMPQNILVDRGYKYGSAWLVDLVPPEVVEELKQLFTKEEKSV